jgi:hypothetical protein
MLFLKKKEKKEEKKETIKKKKERKKEKARSRSRDRLGKTIYQYELKWQTTEEQKAEKAPMRGQGNMQRTYPLPSNPDHFPYLGQY